MAAKNDKLPGGAPASTPGAGAGIHNPFAGAARGPRLPDNGRGAAAAALDDIIDLDCTEVSGDGLLIDEGTYAAKLIGFDRVESKSSSNENLEWEFRLLGGKQKNQTIKAWTSLTPAARWKIVQFLAAFGIEAAGQQVKFKPSDLLGKPVDLEIYQNEYTDPKTKRSRMTSKINAIYPPSEETMRLFQADSPVPGGAAAKAPA